MKRLLGAILLVTFLNGCAGLPLVSTLEGSLSLNGAIGAATGKYETQAVNALVNLASHNTTGKTVSQHLYAAVENKYTKKRLEKHFKNKELSISNMKIDNRSLNDFSGFLPTWPKKVKKESIHPPGQVIHNTTPVVKKINNTPIRYVELVNYTVLDKYAPSYKYEMNIKKEAVDFTLQCSFSYYCKKTDSPEMTF
jgi:hypothetical protein